MKKEKQFNVVLTIGGIDHSFKSDNIAEAMSKCKDLKIAGKCVLKVSLTGNDTKPFVTLFPPIRLRRLFHNALTQTILQKNVEKHFLIWQTT